MESGGLIMDIGCGLIPWDGAVKKKKGRVCYEACGSEDNVELVLPSSSVWMQEVHQYSLQCDGQRVDGPSMNMTEIIIILYMQCRNRHNKPKWVLAHIVWLGISEELKKMQNEIGEVKEDGGGGEGLVDSSFWDFRPSYHGLGMRRYWMVIVKISHLGPRNRNCRSDVGRKFHGL